MRKLLAAQYSATGQYEQAIALLAPVVDRPPYDEEAHLLLIGARQASGDSEGVFALATRAQRRFPRSPQVAAWLGFQLQFSGRYEEAEKELRKAIDLEPSFGVPYQLLGEVYLKREEYVAAVEWFRKAVNIMPEDVETLMGLGRALAALDNTDAALEALGNAPREWRRKRAGASAPVAAVLSHWGRGEGSRRKRICPSSCEPLRRSALRRRPDYA